METRIFQDNNMQCFVITNVPLITKNEIIIDMLNYMAANNARYIGDENDLYDIGVEFITYKYNELQLISFDKSEQEQINIANYIMLQDYYQFIIC